MRTLKLIGLIFYITLVQTGYSQETISVDKATRVLVSSKKVTSAKAGEMKEHPQEIVAFNAIYKSKNPNESFKSVYKKGNSAGKFYALVGLYLLKDKEFKNYNEKFNSSPQANVNVIYGCKGSEDQDIKGIFKTWMEGIDKGLWYTDIIIKN